MKMPEIKDEDWDRLGKAFGYYDKNDKKETKWEALKWEISWWYNNKLGSLRSFFKSISNFWKWRKIIWNDRWYDHSFLHQMLRFKLNDTADGWKDCHYVDCEKEEKELRELVALLDEIDELEDSFEEGNDAKMDEKYQAFGRKLFDIRDFENEHDEKKFVTRFSAIRKFWD